MEGGTLDAFITEQGPVDPITAFQLLEPVVYALAEAHGRGITHRDIKPSNILFGSAGNRRIVKLADFGIAKGASIPNRAQNTQGAGGKRISLYSPGWASPEQMRARAVGPTTDVFSLGLVLAFMITGKKIFRDEGLLESFTDRLEGDTHVGKIINHLNVPGPLAAVIMRACRVSPSDRYSTVEEFLSAVKEASEKVGPVHSGPPMTEIPLTKLNEPAVIVEGQRIWLVEANGPLELGSDGAGPFSKARFRATFLPSADHQFRLHIRGLNCFVAKEGQRPTSAADLDSDCTLEFFSSTREKLDVVRCVLGTTKVSARVLPLGRVALSVPLTTCKSAVLLDYGPGRERAVLYRSVK
jgi:serine/threonine-protein kinase